SKYVQNKIYSDENHRIIDKNVILLLPYDANYSTDLDNTLSSGTGTKINRNGGFVELKVSQETSITVNGTITVNALINGNGSQHGYVEGSNYSQLYLDADSELIINGTLNTLGFIYGEGTIDTTQNAKIYDILTINDFRGGGTTTAVYKDVFPFDQISFHHIESNLRINSGAKYYARLFIWMSLWVKEEVFVIGSGTDKALLTISNGYISKDYNSTNGVNILSINGDGKINDIEMSINGQDVNTKNKEMPFSGNFEIVVEDGANLEINTGIKLLPGAKLTVKEDASLTINKNSRLVVFDENEYSQQGRYPTSGTTIYRIQPVYHYKLSTPAEFILDGTLIVKGTVAGKISTSDIGIVDIEETAFTKLTINNVEPVGAIAKYTFSLKTTNGILLDDLLGKYFIEDDGETWFYNIEFHDNIDSNLSETIKQKYGEEYNLPTWFDDNDMTLYTDEDLIYPAFIPPLVNKSLFDTLYAGEKKDEIILSFETNGGIVLFNNEEITEITLPKGASIHLDYDFKPYKDEESLFDGWYYDENYQNKFNPNQRILEDISIYLKWVDAVTIRFETNGGLAIPNEMFLKSEKINLNEEIIPERDGFTFIGWYKDYNFENLWDKDAPVNDSITVYARWLTNNVSINLTLDPASVNRGGKSKITAKVNSGDPGDNVANIKIIFSLESSTGLSSSWEGASQGKTNIDGSFSATVKGDLLLGGVGQPESRGQKIFAEIAGTTIIYSITLIIKNESSPYIYSTDKNGNLHFEHEPISFSMLKAVEGTTFGTLRLMQDQNGIYYIQIIEEGDSTTALNSAKLYAIDYEANQGVIDAMFDVNGNPHTIKERISPITFVDQNGVSHLGKVLFNDNDMAFVGETDDLISYFVATFNRTNNNRYAKLMVTPREVGNTLGVLYPILASINGIDNLWWIDQAFMNDPESHASIQNLFDSLLQMRIEVWNGSEWILQGTMDPKTYINEEMLIVLDLDGINEEEIKVRISFASELDYHIDSIYIDFSEDVNMIVHDLTLESAILNGSEDVKDLMLNNDEYIYLEYKEGVRLGFAAPELLDGYERFIGVSMKGYIYALGANVTDELLEETIGKSFEEVKAIILASGREELVAYVDAVEELYYTLVYIGSLDYEEIIYYMFTLLAEVEEAFNEGN
ncbi:MAG: InlB B-repeat-containing protein, partial [Acholeplasmataceae bacterium]